MKISPESRILGYLGRSNSTMIEIAEFLPPTPTPLWKLAKQAGVDFAVGGLPFNEPFNGTDAAWDYLPLVRMKQRYESGGFTLSVIEARPPLNKAKRGLPGRDEEIDVVCTLLENMGKLGIPVWCYEWMTDFNWLRTGTTTRARQRQAGYAPRRPAALADPRDRADHAQRGELSAPAGSGA
jgi:D-mannonate dehydratase